LRVDGVDGVDDVEYDCSNERGGYKRPVRILARFTLRPGIKLDCHFRGRAANFACILTVPCVISPNDPLCIFDQTWGFY
jgi:hypothetical protein